MKYCAEQGCKDLITQGRYCEDHKRKQSKKSAHYSKNRPFYRTQAWYDLKAYCYQRDGGCCVRCGKFVMGKQAHHHHDVPIWKDETLKLDPDNILTVCPKCHMVLEDEANEKYKPRAKYDWNIRTPPY